MDTQVFPLQTHSPQTRKQRVITKIIPPNSSILFRLAHIFLMTDPENLTNNHLPQLAPDTTLRHHGYGPSQIPTLEFR